MRPPSPRHTESHCESNGRQNRRPVGRVVWTKQGSFMHGAGRPQTPVYGIAFVGVGYAGILFGIGNLVRRDWLWAGLGFALFFVAGIIATAIAEYRDDDMSLWFDED